MTDAPAEKAAPQRDSPRAPVSFDALLELKSDLRAIRVSVVDISESGARLTGPLEGAEGEGELQLENGLAVPCTVVRPGPDSCGLRFGKLEEKVRADLRHLLASLVRSFEEEAVLTPRGPVELSAEGLLSGEMYERFGLKASCTDEELAERGAEVLAAVESALASAEGERKRRLAAVRKSFARLKPTWKGGEERAVYNKHAGLDGAEDRPERGVQGKLEDIGAADILASLADGRRNAEVLFSVDGEDRATVAVEGGACVGAFAGDAQGEDALKAAAALSRGLFYVNYALPRDRLRNMEVTAEALKAVAEAARGADAPDIGPLPGTARIEAPMRDERGAARQRTEPRPAAPDASAKSAAPKAAEPKRAAPTPAPASGGATGLLMAATLGLLVVLIVLVVLAARSG